MAKPETVAYVLKGLCLLWHRDFDDFVFDAYCEACRGYCDALVKRAAMELALQSKWFPLPSDLHSRLWGIVSEEADRVPEIAEAPASKDVYEVYMREIRRIMGGGDAEKPVGADERNGTRGAVRVGAILPEAIAPGATHAREDGRGARRDGSAHDGAVRSEEGRAETGKEDTTRTGGGLT